jgi:branched-chain amino acid transport system substrate-binding protein
MGQSRIFLGLLLGIGLSLGATSAKAAEPYDVSVILPLTGNASFVGKSEQQSLQLAEKIVNANGAIQGRLLHFSFQDDETSAQLAVQLAGQVIAKQPTVMFGSALVALCAAIAPLMQNGPVDYCLSPGLHPAAGSFAFTCSESTHDLTQTLIAFFHSKGWNKIAVLTSTDATGQDEDHAIDDAIKLPTNTGLQIVAHEHFNTSDISVSAQIEHIKAAQPQAVIAWTTGTPIATIFRGIAQAGLEVPIATTDGNMTYAQMTQYAAFLPKQLYIATGLWVTAGSGGTKNPAVAAAQQRFVEAFKTAGIKPEVSSAHPWDPTMIVVDALRKLGPKATAAQLRDYMIHLKGYAGVNGVYDFESVPQRGLDATQSVVTAWDTGKGTWVPVSAATH